MFYSFTQSSMSFTALYTVTVSTTEKKFAFGGCVANAAAASREGVARVALKPAIS